MRRLLLAFPSPPFHPLLRWIAAAGNAKLLQTFLTQGQGWARGYAAAAIVECVKVLSDATSGSNSSSSSGANGPTQDVAAILTAIFEVLNDEKVTELAASRMRVVLQFIFTRAELSSVPQISRSIGDERDCCACINYILHSSAPLLLPSALEAHVNALRSVVTICRDVQAVVAWQQLALLTQLGRIPRSSCDWFIDAIAAAAAGPSTPALRMALATALRAFIIAHQLPPLPLLSRFLSCTLVPEPASNEVTFNNCVHSHTPRTPHKNNLSSLSLADHGGVHSTCARCFHHWAAWRAAACTRRHEKFVFLRRGGSVCPCALRVYSLAHHSPHHAVCGHLFLSHGPRLRIPSEPCEHETNALFFTMQRSAALCSHYLFVPWNTRHFRVLTCHQGWTLVTALSFPRVPEVAQLWDVLLDWWAISLAGGIALPASHKDLVVEYSNRAAALESLHQFVSTLHSSTPGSSPDVSRPHEFHTTFEVVSDLVMKNLRSELLQKRPPELCESALTSAQETSLFCASDNMRCWLTRMMKFIPLDSLSAEFHSILDKQFKVLTSSRGIGTQLTSSCAPAHPSDVLTMFLPGGHTPAFQRM